MKKTPQKVSSYEDIKKVDKRKFVIVKGFVFKKKEYNQLEKDLKSIVAEDLDARTSLVSKFCKNYGIKDAKDISEIYHSISKNKKTIKKILKQEGIQENAMTQKRIDLSDCKVLDLKTNKIKEEDKKVKIKDGKAYLGDKKIAEIVICEDDNKRDIIDIVILSIAFIAVLVVIHYYLFS